MVSYKIRQMMKSERELIQKRFRKQRNRNRLASPGPHECIVVLDHLKPSFNIGKIFRSAETFGVREIHLVGVPYFDPSPAMGAFKWVPAKFHNNFLACYTTLLSQGYTLYVLEPGKGPAISQVDLPCKSAFIFGHEEFGLSFESDLYPEIRRLTIPQFGRSESLNVSIAASIVLYEYTRQNAVIDKADQEL